MKSNKKTSLIALSMIAGLCITAGTWFSAKADSATVYAFSGTEIAGVQARLDNDGMRFVLEMNVEDYAEYTKTEEYTYEAGVVMIPEDLAGDELTVDTATAQVIRFTDYTPATVTENGATTYRFNAVLKGIPQFGRKIAARGFVKATNKTTNAETYAYTDAAVSTVSYVASAYFDDYAEDSDEYAKITSYVIGGYNDVYSKSITSLDEIEIGLSMNDADAIMADNTTVKGYSNQLKIADGLDSLLMIDYSSADTDGQGTANTLPTVLSTDTRIQVECGEVTAQEGARGTAAVVATACGGKVSEVYFLKVLDETIVSTNSHYNPASGKYGTDTNAVYHLDGTFTYYPTAYANSYLNFANKATDCVIENDSVSFTLNVDRGIYLQSHLEYNKDELKMLMDAGYDKLVMPVKVAVKDEVLKTSAFNYVSSGSQDSEDFTESYRNYLDLYTANANITGTNNVMGFISSGSNSWVNCGKIYVNEWTNIELPLQVIYDNYAQFTKMTTTGNTYETRSWPLFGISNENYGDNPDPSWVCTVSLKKFFVAKTNGATTEKPVDFSNPDVLKSISWQNVYGTQGLSQVGFKDGTVAGRTGRFLQLCNITRVRGSYNVWTESKNTQKYLGLYMDLGVSKEQLEQLKADGYKYLTLDAIGEKLWGSLDKVTIGYNQTAMAASSSNSNLSFDGEKWNTFYINIDNLIDNYDSYTTGAIGTRFPLIWTSAESGAFCFDVYVDNIKFVK